MDSHGKSLIDIGYFYLGAKNSALKFQKIHIQEKMDYRGK
ncbi:hypothetical protein SEVCU013_0002 [Staphylococcus epidermidis VCU013]|nr:hypothetical protein SEVCU013_0002 [Staphylococcus epidermidis VCU013]